MGKRAERNRATTSVVLGWIVKKRYRDQSGIERTKVVSRRFTSKGAAETFMGISEKSNVPVFNQTEVVFYVGEDNGFDDIPGGA